MTHEIARSNRIEVRNPILGLPSAKRIMELDPAARLLLADLLKELSVDAREKAETNWKRSKAPIAAYWRASSTVAGHLSRALRRPEKALEVEAS